MTTIGLALQRMISGDPPLVRARGLVPVVGLRLGSQGLAVQPGSRLDRSEQPYHGHGRRRLGSLLAAVAATPRGREIGVNQTLPEPGPVLSHDYVTVRDQAVTAFRLISKVRYQDRAVTGLLSWECTRIGALSGICSQV